MSTLALGRDAADPKMADVVEELSKSWRRDSYESMIFSEVKIRTGGFDIYDENALTEVYDLDYEDRRRPDIDGDKVRVFTLFSEIGAF